MALIKCKGEAYLVVKDKNNKSMIRKVEVFPEWDDTIVGMDTQAARKDRTRQLLGSAILQFCANGLEPAKLTFMGVSAVYLSEMEDASSNLAAYITGYDNPLSITAVLPDNYVVEYSMFRRAKYIGNNPATGNRMVYFKTPENVQTGDPVEHSELPAAFPLLFSFANLVNNGDIGASKLYTDWRYIYNLTAIELSDHVQDRSGKIS